MHELEELKRQEEGLIDRKAVEIYRNEERKLSKAYKDKELKLNFVFLSALMYGILCTLCTAVRSNAFVGDFKAFFVGVWAFICKTFNGLYTGAVWASEVAYKVNQYTLGKILHWLIIILVMIIGVLLILAVLFFVSCFIIEWIKEYADKYTLAIILSALAGIVFFADIKFFLPVNLIGLLFIIIIVGEGARMLLLTYFKK